MKLGKNGTLAANNANITGTVTANLLYANSGGTIGGFTINSTYLANKKDAYNDTKEGVYIGTNGIGLGAGKFWVSDDGYLHAATGEFTGDIKGGTININNNFMVDTDGNVTMTKGSININGKFVVASDGNTILNGGSININDKFIVDSNGNVQLKGSITWGAGSSPVQSVFARTSLTKPADGTKYSSFASSSSTAWHTTFDTTNDRFASYTYDGGVTWTDTVQVVGTDASVTDQNVFNAITSNQTMYGCFTNNSDKLYINATRINSGALTVSNASGTIFSADIDSKIVQIGGWIVTNQWLKSNGAESGVYCGMYSGAYATDAYYTCNKPSLVNPGTYSNGRFYAGATESEKISSSKFTVLDDGSLYALAAKIEGDIVATSGTIGGCTISNGVLQISSANITGKLTSDKIDATNLAITNTSGNYGVYLSAGRISVSSPIITDGVPNGSYDVPLIRFREVGGNYRQLCVRMTMIDPDDDLIGDEYMTPVGIVFH